MLAVLDKSSHMLGKVQTLLDFMDGNQVNRGYGIRPFCEIFEQGVFVLRSCFIGGQEFIKS